MTIDATEKYLDEGIYAAALTPMHPDLSCNFLALVDHCLDLMRLQGGRLV